MPPCTAINLIVSTTNLSLPSPRYSISAQTHHSRNLAGRRTSTSIHLPNSPRQDIFHCSKQILASPHILHRRSPGLIPTHVSQRHDHSSRRASTWNSRKCRVQTKKKHYNMVQELVVNARITQSSETHQRINAKA